MKFREILFFIAKSLTISSEKKNRHDVERTLKTKDIDWEAVVKVSTSQYVLPAIYCNFKRANFLKYLPTDLVGYMKYITKLNRERNIKIIEQAKELNHTLLSNKVRPIFLKGTGNLLAGIYEDIGERMVGDIDFIFSKEDYPKAISILKEFGYSDAKKRKYYRPAERHYRKLKKKGNIAAIEIHSRFINEKKYDYEFNYNFVVKDILFIKGAAVLSFANKLNLTIIDYQINDNGFYYKRIALRNAYDVFILSHRVNTKDSINSLNRLSHSLNYFLAACHEVFNCVETIDYNKNAKTTLYLKNFNKQFTKPIKEQSKRNKLYLFIKRTFYILYKSIIYKEYRIFLVKSLTDKNWYYQKLNQLGIKNVKTNKQEL